MKTRNTTRRSRFSNLMLAFVVLGTSLLGTLAPLFTDTAGATTLNPNSVSLAQKTTVTRGADVTNPLQTCIPYYASVIKSAQFLKDEFFDNIETVLADGLPAYRNRLGNAPMRTKIGNFDLRDPIQYDQVLGIIQVGAEVPVIKFENAPAGTSPINGTYQGAGGSICGSLTMIPIRAYEWRGMQTQVNCPRICAGGNTQGVGPEWMSFENSTDNTGPNRIGTLLYHNYVSPGVGVPFQYPTPQTRFNNFVVRGAPNWGTPGGGTVGVGIFRADWIDAAHIRITDGPRTGEVYRKYIWDAASVNGAADWSLYFLESTTATSDTTGNRAKHTWASGDGCENPITITASGTGAPSGACTTQNGGNNHCVPFIAVHQAINLSQVVDDVDRFDMNTQQFQTRANDLGNADATFYDYNAQNCSYIGHSPGTKLGNQLAAKIWFYYSATAKAIVTVFTDGAGNEIHYVGQYALTTDNNFAGPNGGCYADVSVDLAATNSSAVYNTSWVMTDGNCTRRVAFTPTVNVLTQGGSAGETGFLETTDVIAGNADTTAESDAPRIGCDFIEGNPLNWIVCPVIKAGTNLIGYLDSAINQMLNIDVQDIFDDSQQPGQAYHKAWAVFRTFALAMIVIAALFMVIAQAAGVEFLDAYTIRKVLPRILIAAIGITLSWELMQFAVTLSNDLGNGVRSLIYAPFQSLNSSGIQLANISKSLMAIFEVGAVLAYGWFGLLSLVLTGVLAVIVGFLVLTFRRILIIFLVIVSPLAIALYILPNTQKAWKLWRDSLVGALLVFVIISAFIAVGRVFSLTALLASTRNGTLDLGLSQFIAIVAYFIPYFLMPFAFRLAGGFVATIGGLVNDRSRGIFDGLRNFRNRTATRRNQAWRSGSLYRDNALARPLNALGKRVGAAQAGAGIHAFAPTARGRAARAIYDRQLAESTLKNNPLLNELQQDDDANGVLGMSGGTEAGLQEAARDLFTDEYGVYNGQRADRAMAAARAVGVNRANALAAARTSMANKARAFTPGNIRALDRGVRRITRNTEEYTGMSQQLAFFARSNGRADLGGTDWIDYGRDNALWQQARAVAPNNEMQQWQVVSDGNILNGIERTSVQAMVAGHDNQAAQYMRTLSRILQTSPVGSDERLQAAVALKEFQGNLPAGTSGGVRDEINRVLYTPAAAGGLGINPNDNVANQLAAMVGRPGLTGQSLTTMGRVYPEYGNPAQTGQAQPPGTP